MKKLRQAFLLWIGTWGVAYEETTKRLKQQQHKLNQRFNRKAA